MRTVLYFVVEAALNGIKDLVTKHPAELKLHKVAMIEKLQEWICDSDKVVRESLYTILQSLIFPSLKEVPPPHPLTKCRGSCLTEQLRCHV
jgi:hypothetical protein